MAPRIVRRNRNRPPAALTAASTPIRDPAKDLKTSTFGSSAATWQDEAWEFLDEVGELRYHVEWLASSVSRGRLIASDVDPMTGEPTGTTESDVVASLVHDIGSGLAAQSQLLYRLAVILSVPGEGYLAMIAPDPSGEGPFGDDAAGEQWLALSRDEVRKDARGDITIDLPTGHSHAFDTENDLLFRVWNQHPRKASEADSPVRAARKALLEIRRSTARIDNASRSRAVGNGVMFLPEELSLPGTRSDPDEPARASADDLQDMLMEVATTAVDQPDSLAAFLPIMATVPGEWADKVSHVKFDSDVTPTTLTTRDSAIRRLALSLNTSPERLLGIGANSNHWSAWAIDENDVKVHIAPILETICDALTQNVLRPMLRRIGIDADKYTVWYDTTPLTQDPDRKDEARDAYDRGAITAEAYRRYLGFDDADGYMLDTADGWRALAADRAARDVTLIPMLAPLLDAEAGQIDAAAIPPGGAPAAPATVDTDIPATEDAARTAAARVVLSLCVARALELANKRRRSRADRARLADTPIRDAHTVLGPVGAEEAREHLAGWSDEVPDAALHDAGVDPDRLRAVVQRVALAAQTSAAAPTVTDVDVREVLG